VTKSRPLQIIPNWEQNEGIWCNQSERTSVYE
jgi:hypothetical protein